MNWRNSINCKLYAIKSHNLWSHYKLNNNKTIEYTTYCYGNKDYKMSVLFLHESYQLSSSPQQEHLAYFCHELSFTWLQCTIHRNQFVIQVSIKPNNIYLSFWFFSRGSFSSHLQWCHCLLETWVCGVVLSWFQSRSETLLHLPWQLTIQNSLTVALFHW